MFPPAQAEWLPGECATQSDIAVCPLKSLTTYSMVAAMERPDIEERKKKNHHIFSS